MKKSKTQKGITLIALIITIIVLLILAVVTIGAVREGGIITHAQNAVRDYIVSGEKEQIQLAYSNYKISKYTPIERTEDQDELEEYFVGKTFLSVLNTDKTTEEYYVVNNYDGSEIIIPLPDGLVSDGENVYIYFEYNGYNYISTADTKTSQIKALELDKENSTRPLKVEGAEVTGSEESGWIVVFNETGNKYNVSSDGEIERAEQENLDVQEWDIAWISDGTMWSEKYESVEEITEEYSIIAKLSKTGGTVTLSDGTVVGEEYHMTIEGNGQMPPLFNDAGELSSGVAWMENVNFVDYWDWAFVTKLTISEGITNIPNGAFAYGLSLNNITLPSTMNTIGRRSICTMCINKHNNTRRSYFDWN